jgi:hypothetical protein
MKDGWILPLPLKKGAKCMGNIATNHPLKTYRGNVKTLRV